MSENYAEAALRHWRDAELLKLEGRIDNADHLYGFAAECALKVVLLTLPNCSSKGVLNYGYKEHIRELWDKMPVQSIAKPFPGLIPILRLANPFHGWDISQRYSPDESVLPNTLESHRTFTKRLLGAAQLSGTRKI